MSEEAKDLIIKLLSRDPTKRLGYENDAEDIKRHAFFSGVNWGEIEERVRDGPILEKSEKAGMKPMKIDFDGQ